LVQGFAEPVQTRVQRLVFRQLNGEVKIIKEHAQGIIVLGSAFPCAQ
jgi:hypothetical protein